MQKIATGMRKIIGENIRALRMKMFPGHGGSKKCAMAFGVSQQQWSPWETGNRTPDGIRLEEMAAFFSVSVEYFYERHGIPDVSWGNTPDRRSDSHYAPNLDIPEGALSPPKSAAGGQASVGNPPPSASEGASCPHCRAPVPGQPSGGNLRSKCKIADSIADSMHGITITIHLKDPDVVNFILKECMSNINLQK